ncbi:hypothetical protein AB996_1644 [Lactococcus cremoris]|uniref:DUF3862 domain-containing protein n=1 Tax=Lactococcus lactis subsp. cremoris TaxID=1359 RepID=A0A166J8R9_LACLC|nr:hypothetical protein [Lactococcus cremoris]KZK05763.1 hypothetical protein AB996_1644 [Lactococcus cremoris]
MFRIFKLVTFLPAIFLLTACSNQSNSIAQKAYAQLSSKEKAEISGKKANIETLTLSQKDESAYHFSKKYIGEKVYAVHFNGKKDLMGEVIYLVSDDKIIGENLRD